MAVIIQNALSVRTDTWLKIIPPLRKIAFNSTRSNLVTHSPTDAVKIAGIGIMVAAGLRNPLHTEARKPNTRHILLHLPPSVNSLYEIPIHLFFLVAPHYSISVQMFRFRFSVSRHLSLWFLRCALPSWESAINAYRFVCQTCFFHLLLWQRLAPSDSFFLSVTGNIINTNERARFDNGFILPNGTDLKFLSHLQCRRYVFNRMFFSSLFPGKSRDYRIRCETVESYQISELETLHCYSRSGLRGRVNRSVTFWFSRFLIVMAALLLSAGYCQLSPVKIWKNCVIQFVFGSRW